MPVLAAGTGLVAATYGLVRLAYGLYLPDVRAELGLGVSAAGLVSAGSSIVYGLGALTGLVLAARRARLLVVAAAVTGGGGALGMAAAPDVVTFSVAAVVGSAGAGLASPALVALVQRSPAARRRPGAQSVVNAGTGPGLVLAGLLALVLLPDWRLAWSASGVVTVVLAGLVLVASEPDEPDAPGPGALPMSWFAQHRRVVAAALMVGAGSAAVWSYGRTLLVDAGARPAVTVVAWVALGVGGTAVIATAGRLDRLGPPRAWALTAAAVGGSTAALALGSGHAVVALAACLLFGWSFVAATGALIAWSVQIDAERAAAGTGLLFVVLVLGQAVGAAAVGTLAPLVGQTATFLVAAVVSALSVPVSGGLRRRRVAGAATPGRPRAGRVPSRRSG